MYSGSIVALATPFKNFQVDYNAVRHLVQWHIEKGTKAIVACGSTGEAMFLSDQERAEILRVCRETAAGKLPIIMGCGGAATDVTVGMAQAAKQGDADALLVVTPYYVKPKDAGIIEHYRQIAEVGVPIILYNNPGRTVADMSVDLICKIAETPGVIGLKDSNTDLCRVVQLRKQLGSDFALLSGDDPVALGYMAYGGDGCISVAANIVPDLCQGLMDAWFARDFDTVAKLRDRLQPLYQTLFIESNPTPLKYAMKLMGLCNGELRLPLVEVSGESARVIENQLRELNLV